MAKDLRITFLLDFYGDMLTEKQREVVECYYNEDLSLAEIAEEKGITRQGVRDAIKRAEQQMFEMEERLGLVRRFRTIRGQLQQVTDAAQRILDCNHRYCGPAEITEQARRIASLAEQLND